MNKRIISSLVVLPHSTFEFAPFDNAESIKSLKIISGMTVYILYNMKCTTFVAIPNTLRPG